MTERETAKERIHPHKIIAGAVAFYYQDFLDQAQGHGVILDENHKFVRGVRRFLAEYKTLMGGVMPTRDELFDFKNLTMEVAELQKEAKMEGLGQREFVRKHSDKYDPKLLSTFGKPWLVKTYENSLFKNMLAIYQGKLKFGFGMDVDRDEPDNALASDMLMDTASDRIVGDLVKLFGSTDPKNIHVIELGAGSGNFSKKMLRAFKGSTATVSDINPKTQSAARETLADFVEGKDFELAELDMKDTAKLKELAEKLKGKQIIIHIGFIFHENRKLALATLKALREAFAGMNVVFAFTEYAMQNEIMEDVPLHFQGIHYTTQDLFYRYEFLSFVRNNGFSRCKNSEGEEMESVHNYLTKTKSDGTPSREVMNSTTYWTI